MKRKLSLYFALLLAISVTTYIAITKVGATRGTGFVASASSSITQGSLQWQVAAGATAKSRPGVDFAAIAIGRNATWMNENGILPA